MMETVVQTRRRTTTMTETVFWMMSTVVSRVRRNGYRTAKRMRMPMAVWTNQRAFSA